MRNGVSLRKGVPKVEFGHERNEEGGPVQANEKRRNSSHNCPLADRRREFTLKTIAEIAEIAGRHRQNVALRQAQGLRHFVP